MSKCLFGNSRASTHKSKTVFFSTLFQERKKGGGVSKPAEFYPGTDTKLEKVGL